MVERGGLENRCGPLGHRGFESHPLRQKRASYVADALYASSLTSTKNFPDLKDYGVNNPGSRYTHIRRTGQTTMA